MTEKETNDRKMMAAKMLFDAKIMTGKYDHYPVEARQMLMQDCIAQVEFSESTRRNRARINRGLALLA